MACAASTVTLIVGRIAVLDAEIESRSRQVEIGEDQLLLDQVCQMTRVISSPSRSATGFVTLILFTLAFSGRQD